MTQLHEQDGTSFQHLVEDAEAAFFDSEREALDVGQRMLLREMEGYSAYALDLDYLWRWDIYQDDGKIVQSGCSISLTSAREAVDHVFAYYRRIESAA